LTRYVIESMASATRRTKVVEAAVEKSILLATTRIDLSLPVAGCASSRGTGTSRSERERAGTSRNEQMQPGTSRNKHEQVGASRSKQKQAGVSGDKQDPAESK